MKGRHWMRLKIVVAFLAGVVIGALIAQSAQSVLDAGEASKMRRSIGNAIALSAALEKVRDNTGSYPPSLYSSQLSQSLTPTYLRTIPTDVHGRPFIVAMTGTVPAVMSLGRGGFMVQKQSL